MKLLAVLLVPVLPGVDIAAQQAWISPVTLQADIQRTPLNCFYQDRTGLIWLGTGAGLYTFNGTVFHPVESPDGEDAAGVTAVFEDADGMLWIGFDNGSAWRYDRMGNYELVLAEDTVNNSRITGFADDRTGHLWIATYGRGAVVRSDTGIVILDNGSGLSDNYIYSMIIDMDGRIWMGTDNGINVCDPSSDPWGITTLSMDEGLPDFIVQTLKMDERGDIWIGMYDRGICRYDRDKGTFSTPEGLADWQYGAVRDMVLMKDRIWVAASGKGIVEYMFNSGRVSFYEQCRNLSLGRVRSMLPDREGNIWLLTSNELFLSFGSKIEFYETIGGLNLKNIHALTIDGQDLLWFADDRGLFSYNPHAGNPDEKPVQHPLAIDLRDQKIMSLYRDRFGIVWIGTFGSGLLRLDPATGKQGIITEKDGLVNGNVLSIAGNDKELWFGTLGGASRCQADDRLKDVSYIPAFQNYGLNEGLVNNYIYQVFLDDDGTPYFATDGNGVLAYRDGIFGNIAPGSEIADEVVYSVARDLTGQTWMNIANKGLYKYDGNVLSGISRNDEHGSMTFSGILGNLSDLVIAYNDGIDILDIQTGSIRHFEENAGISAIDPDLNTLARDSENNVWIGTARGIIKVQPLEEGLWKHPMISLTGVSLFLNPVDHLARQVFSHDENHLTFSFSGLWFQYPQRVEYLFKLEGHDLDWIRTRNDQVIYSDLKPGQYTFRVKAGIYGNFSLSNEAVYTFRIREPFYTAAWFYLFVALFLGVVVAVAFSIRLGQVRRKEEIIQEKIRFQFENLKSQINPHFLFNSFSTLMALIEEDPKSAVTYVEDLSMLFRNILEYKDQELISLDREFRIAGNYINLQKKRFGDSLVVEIEETDAFNGVKIPPLTLQLLIENAIKHNVVSREKPLLIRIFSLSGENRIFVENNIQAKMDNTPSTGIGISNIVNRYKLLTGREVRIQRTNSTFTVSLPFIN